MKKLIKRTAAALGIAFAVCFTVGVIVEMVSIGRSSYGDFETVDFMRFGIILSPKNIFVELFIPGFHL